MYETSNYHLWVNQPVLYNTCCTIQCSIVLYSKSIAFQHTTQQQQQQQPQTQHGPDSGHGSLTSSFARPSSQQWRTVAEGKPAAGRRPRGASWAATTAAARTRPLCGRGYCHRRRDPGGTSLRTRPRGRSRGPSPFGPGLQDGGRRTSPSVDVMGRRLGGRRGRGRLDGGRARRRGRGCRGGEGQGQRWPTRRRCQQGHGIDDRVSVRYCGRGRRGPRRSGGRPRQTRATRRPEKDVRAVQHNINYVKVLTNYTEN